MKILKTIFFNLFIVVVGLSAHCQYNAIIQYDRETDSFSVWQIDGEAEYLNHHNEESRLTSIEEISFSNFTKKMQEYINNKPLKIYIIDIPESKTNGDISYLATCTN